MGAPCSSSSFVNFILNQVGPGGLSEIRETHLPVTYPWHELVPKQADTRQPIVYCQIGQHDPLAAHILGQHRNIALYETSATKLVSLPHSDPLLLYYYYCAVGWQSLDTVQYTGQSPRLLRRW